METTIETGMDTATANPYRLYLREEQIPTQ